MTKFLTIAFMVSFFTYSQELSSNEYKMNSIKIIHVENNEIYRIGYEHLKNHFFKKSANGEEVAKLQVSYKDKGIICRGILFRNEKFYSISTRDNLDKTTFTLQVIDKDLNVVEEKEIFSEPTSKKNKKAQVFFEYNNNGFILFRDFTRRKKVNIESFIYDFRSEEMHTSNLEFKSKQKLRILDFDFSNELKGALILDADVSIGDLKKGDLKKLETHLLYVEPDKKMTSLKLTEDKNYFERSFNLTFNKENLFIANLNFHNPSNILSGYTVKRYNLASGNSLQVEENLFFEFDDYASKKEWGPLLDEVQKKYEQDKDKSNTGYEPFGALEITDLFINDKKEAVVVVREIFYVKDNSGNMMGSTYLTHSMYTSKRFKEFQITKLDLKTKNIVWWNRIYNAPYTNGGTFTTQINYSKTKFWSDSKVTSKWRIYYPNLESNKLVLLYPTYLTLYDENGELKSELIDQQKFFGLKSTYYNGIGKSEIDLSTGQVENRIVMSEVEGTGHMFSAKVINIEGFYTTDEKIIVPIENPVKRTSILKVSDK